MCIWLGKCFENVLLAGEILKKTNNVKKGGTMFVYRCLRCTNMVPPILNILTFLEFPQSEAHCRKSF